MPIELDSLKESSEFMNLLLDNINSAVLIADEHFRIHQFNKGFLNLFDRSARQLTDHSFGQVTGCVNAVIENKTCGETSKCYACVLRKSLIETLIEDVPSDRKRLERIFYIEGRPVMKYLEFSTRLIHFRDRRMILVIIYDITELEQQKKELERKQAIIEQDLAAAGEIQKSLLPHLALDIPNIQTAWRFEPCRQVGGDIFQIHLTSEDHISTYVLDVCGHGISAALVAVTVSQFLLSLHNRMRLSGILLTPAEVVDRLEKAFPLDRFDCYFTIAYATLDIRTGRLVYSNAGHVPPLILRADGKLIVLAHHGPVIGTGFDPSFGQETQQLNPGDRFILYTDGLIDNFASAESEGKNRFYETLLEFSAQEVADMVDDVFSRFKSLRGDVTPSDDMSLLAIEYAHAR